MRTEAGATRMGVIDFQDAKDAANLRKVMSSHIYYWLVERLLTVNWNMDLWPKETR